MLGRRQKEKGPKSEGERSQFWVVEAEEEAEVVVDRIRCSRVAVASTVKNSGQELTRNYLAYLFL